MPVARRDKIRVILAEDQTMVLGALAALLEMEADIEVIARARNGQEALRLVQERRPDVFITDIEMPKLTGLEAAAELKRQGLPVRVIILTTFARAGYLRRALEAGASGYLLKDMPAPRHRPAARSRSLERRTGHTHRPRAAGVAFSGRRHGYIGHRR